MRHLERTYRHFGAGTGNPYFTTDTAASLRAVEVEADVILKGTRWMVSIPQIRRRTRQLHRYDKITFREVYQKNLNVMDMTAFTLCEENRLPIIVFDMNKQGNLSALLSGEQVGTLCE